MLRRLVTPTPLFFSFTMIILQWLICHATLVGGQPEHWLVTCHFSGCSVTNIGSRFECTWRHIFRAPAFYLVYVIPKTGFDFVFFCTLVYCHQPKTGQSVELVFAVRLALSLGASTFQIVGD
jgi:hypothetical protein